MNKLIAKYLVYYPLQKLRKQTSWIYKHEVTSNQFLEKGRLEKLQNKKIRNLIRSAYETVPYYRELFDSLGVSPDDIKSIKDLQKLPVMSKKEVLDHEKELIAQHDFGKLYTRKTGGSTGMTLHFMKDAKALAKNDAIMFRCYDWYGIDVGDKQVRFWGVPVTSKLRWKEQFKDFVLNRIRVSAFELTEEESLKQYRRIKKFRPDYFYGYTTAIYGFCLYMKKAGIDLNTLKLKAVICTAEKMYPHHIELFNEMFDCPVVDEYGSSENGIISFQCKDGNMHLMSDHLAIEFLGQDDKPVNDGELGRVVVTDLESFAMPLLRYDIGDMGKPSAKTCECGVTLPLMEIVEGRKEDFIKTKDGKLVHAAYLCYTLKEDTVHEFKMYQKAIDNLLVQIVKSPIFDESTETKLENNLRTALGDDVQIEFEYLERIPREKSGKLRYFVSELGQGNSTE